MLYVEVTPPSVFEVRLLALSYVYERETLYCPPPLYVSEVIRPSAW